MSSITQRAREWFGKSKRKEVLLWAFVTLVLLVCKIALSVRAGYKEFTADAILIGIIEFTKFILLSYIIVFKR